MDSARTTISASRSSSSTCPCSSNRRRTAKLLDAEGKLANEGTRELLHKFAEAFAAWIEATARR